MTLDIGVLRGKCLLVAAHAQEIDLAELDEWIRVLEHQDAFGCMTDPTGWRATMDDRAESLRHLRALREYRRAIEPASKEARS